MYLHKCTNLFGQILRGDLIVATSPDKHLDDNNRLEGFTFVRHSEFLEHFLEKNNLGCKSLRKVVWSCE